MMQTAQDEEDDLQDIMAIVKAMTNAEDALRNMENEVNKERPQMPADRTRPA